MAKAILASKEVKELSLYKSAAVLAPALTPLARLAKHLFMRHRPGDRRDRKRQDKQVCQLLANVHTPATTILHAPTSTVQFSAGTASLLAMRDELPLFIAASLTWIAGFVDAVGFLSLGGIYTANMSGNSVAIGIQGAAQNWPAMLRRMWPVAIYVLGLLLCRLLVEFGARERIRKIASFAFAVEVALLTPACLATRAQAAGDSYLYIALLALAMGVQNAALTHFSSLTLHTGFVTGTLLKVSEEFTKFLTWSFDQLRRPNQSISTFLSLAPKQKPLRVALWLAAIWTLYVVGAICGALSHKTIQLRSLAVPIAGLALMISVDLVHPLAIREEQEQAKLSS